MKKAALFCRNFLTNAVLRGNISEQSRDSAMREWWNWQTR